MAKRKQRGDGDVYPRKNKEGKVIGYRGTSLLGADRRPSEAALCLWQEQGRDPRGTQQGQGG